MTASSTKIPANFPVASPEYYTDLSDADLDRAIQQAANDEASAELSRLLREREARAEHRDPSRKLRRLRSTEASYRRLEQDAMARVYSYEARAHYRTQKFGKGEEVAMDLIAQAQAAFKVAEDYREKAIAVSREGDQLARRIGDAQFLVGVVS